MQNVTMSMAGVVKGLDRAMGAMNLANVTEMLDKFEKQQEDIDVKVRMLTLSAVLRGVGGISCVLGGRSRVWFVLYSLPLWSAPC